MWSKSRGQEENRTSGSIRLARVLGAQDPDDYPVAWAGAVLILLACAVRIAFWLTVDRYWEDALITCLHAENAASGLGLSHFRPGEPPLHGFTSPLSVLIPLLADLVHVGWGIQFLKLVSVFAGGAVVFYIVRIGLHKEVRLPGPLILLAGGYCAFEHQQILFGMAGMETQVVVLVLAASLYYLIDRRTWALGISLALCMYARPDFAMWTVVAGVIIFCQDRRRFMKVAGFALACYAPWLDFTAAYYGSPIPNTVLAKPLGYAPGWQQMGDLTLFNLKRHTWITLSEGLLPNLSPHFDGHGSKTMDLYFGPAPGNPLTTAVFWLAVLGGAAALVRRKAAWVAAAAFCGVYGLYYVFIVPGIFAWYKPPYLAMTVLLAAGGVQALTWPLRRWPRARLPLLSTLAIAYVALFAVKLPTTFYAEWAIQNHIENPVRKAAGLWLGEHMAENEAVLCEPLGYIGYYSRREVLDHPGLASRKMNAYLAKPGADRSMGGAIKGLEPAWLFLRELEAVQILQRNDAAWYREHYVPVKEFRIEPGDEARVPWAYANIDRHFRVYARRDRAEGLEEIPWPAPQDVGWD